MFFIENDCKRNRIDRLKFSIRKSLLKYVIRLKYFLKDNRRKNLANFNKRIVLHKARTSYQRMWKNTYRYLRSELKGTNDSR